MAIEQVTAEELAELRALKVKVEEKRARNKQKGMIRRGVYKKHAPELRAALQKAGFKVRE